MATDTTLPAAPPRRRVRRLWIPALFVLFPVAIRVLLAAAVSGHLGEGAVFNLTLVFQMAFMIGLLGVGAWFFFLSGLAPRVRLGAAALLAGLIVAFLATVDRVEFDGRAFCYLTDTEHVPGAIDRKLAKFMEGADAVVYDSMYTDEEYPRYVGWGHSTWQEGVRLCKAAGVKKLVVFHHDPEHTDEMLDGVAKEVEKLLPGSLVAREGLVLEL